MDTKSKKWISIVSALSFFLSVSLILGSLAGAVRAVGRHGFYSGTPAETLSGNYQSTGEFRNLISSRLENFLVMAVNGPLGYYDYYGDYPAAAMERYAEEYAGAVEEAAEAYGDNWSPAIESWSLEGDFGGWYGGWEYDGRDEPDAGPSEEENKKRAEKYHKSLEKDKNLLYSISNDGKLLYTNAEGTGLPERIDSGAESDWINYLPEGCNFLLYFDGGRVMVFRDGVFEDVYGDGTYRDGEGWYVPGYRNFPAAEEYAGVRICIAAAREPALYNYVSGKTGYRQVSNEIYWLWYHMNEVRNSLIRNFWGLGAGAVFFLIFVCLRKHKKQADVFAARITGKLWIELKALLLLLVCGGAIWIQLADLQANSGLLYELPHVFEDPDYFGGPAEFFGYVGRALLRDLNPLSVLIVFWALWAFVNDLRRNRREWKHGFLYKVYYSLCVKDLDGPASKKMVRRGGLVFLIGAAAQLLLAAFGIAAWIEAGGPAAGVVCMLLIAAFAASAQYAYQRRLRTTAGDVELLAQRVEEIRGGNYGNGGEAPGDEDFRGIFSGLEDIRNGMAEAVDEQMKSERMKVELIANVSHDIKTPLTSIISYVELLKQEDGLPDYVKDYVRILEDKSLRLKNMVQDVFVVSKAASGELPVNMEVLDFGKLLRQTMADMDEQIRGSRLTFKAEIPEEPVLIRADGQRLYRVFQNLLQNAMKYSLEGSRVYITLQKDASLACASVKNTSRSELRETTDFTERFVRGDDSRTDGGSGLGLSIARSFTEACGGEFRLKTIADLFVVTVSFRIADGMPDCSEQKSLI